MGASIHIAPRIHRATHPLGAVNVHTRWGHAVGSSGCGLVLGLGIGAGLVAQLHSSTAGQQDSRAAGQQDSRAAGGLYRRLPP
jgi:hypothetical protein